MKQRTVIHTKIGLTQQLFQHLAPQAVQRLMDNPEKDVTLRLCLFCGEMKWEDGPASTKEIRNIFIEQRSPLDPCRKCEEIKLRYPPLYLWLGQTFFFQKHCLGPLPDYVQINVNTPDPEHPTNQGPPRLN